METKIFTLNGFIVEINGGILSETIETTTGNFLVYATDNDKIIVSDNDDLVWE